MVDCDEVQTPGRKFQQQSRRTNMNGKRDVTRVGPNRGQLRLTLSDFNFDSISGSRSLRNLRLRNSPGYSSRTTFTTDYKDRMKTKWHPPGTGAETHHNLEGVHSQSHGRA